MKNSLCLAIPFLVALLFLGCVLLNSYFIQKKLNTFHHDYGIISGIDFANGKNVTFKDRPTGKRAWTKTESNPRYEALYAKYSLGHDKPLFMFAHGTMYVTNPFVYVSAFDEYDVWWHFWDWNWRFFDDLGTELDNGQPTYDKFFAFLEENDLPTDEVQKAYAEAVKLAGNRHQFNRFIIQFIDKHDKQSTIRLVTQAAMTGKLPNDDINWTAKARQIIQFRDDFPDDLPVVIMEQLMKDENGDPWESAQLDFFLHNYLLRYTEYNALYLILNMTSKHHINPRHGENFLPLVNEFSSLQERGLLEKFLLQIYLENVETPPLPTPAPAEKDPELATINHQFRFIYYEDSYQDLPQREKLLKISCFPDVFKPYWQDRLKKLREKH